MTHFLQDVLRQPDELRGVIELFRGEGAKPLEAAADRMRAARHIYLTGIGASYNAAFGAASHFHSAGYPVYLLDAA
jgi:DNA-binding MurR/RpiR family transcriptional regulator